MPNFSFSFPNLRGESVAAGTTWTTSEERERTFQNKDRLIPIVLLENPLEVRAARSQDQPVSPQHATLAS